MAKFAATNSQILLEAGTNELEILVFTVGDLRCGVNVAKIREVLEVPTVRKTVGTSAPAMQGVGRVRETVVPIADLAQCLFPNEPAPQRKTDQLLLLEFNEDLVGFRVADVDKILRISWKNIQPLPETVGDRALVTGVAVLGEELIPMLDFESIGVGLGMFSSASSEDDAADCPLVRSNHPIAYADDSPLIRELINERLTQAGFTNVRGFRDGQETWDYLTDIAAKTQPEELFEHVAGLVTDIEMPRMDGLTLTRHVRESSVLSKLPVILFSSIASDANENKGIQVGADAQVSKTNPVDLTSQLSKLISQRLQAAQK
ncbi:MAG: chemotaxis protein [Pirellulales bacterium]|nr:chemotaxis protein [Pirellulales bacterium]